MRRNKNAWFRMHLNDKGFFSLIGLLLAAAIMAFLCYQVFTVYFTGSVLNKGASSGSAAGDGKTQNYQFILDNAKQQIENAQAIKFKQVDDLRR